MKACLFLSGRFTQVLLYHCIEQHNDNWMALTVRAVNYEKLLFLSLPLGVCCVVCVCVCMHVCLCTCWEAGRGSTCSSST